MWRSRLWRVGARWIFGAAFVAVAGVAAFRDDGAGRIDGFLYDLALPVAAYWPGGAADEKVAVLALDARSLAAPGIDITPRALLAPYWAKAIDAALGAGAVAVGFDIVFSYTASRFLPDYDQPLLEAFARHSDRLVLARTGQTPIAEPFYFALGLLGDPERAVGFAEVFREADGVNRRMYATLQLADGAPAPTLAAQILAQAGAAPMPEELRLKPRRNLDALPTYSLADVLACAELEPDALRKRLEGRIVLIGTTLAEEDRKLTSDRFFRRNYDGEVGGPVDGERCDLRSQAQPDPDSPTVPGVYLHAAAVRAAIDGEFARLAPPTIRGAVAAGLAALGAAAGFLLPPPAIAAAVTLALAALAAGGAAALGVGHWLPLTAPAMAALLSAVLAYVVRAEIEERKKRRILNAFSHYLAPAVVDRLSESDAELKLGGELREITVMFADLSGFTALSGRMPPEELTDLTNRYLSIIVEAVEETGGYVDKFIGDAVMAIWGAPVADRAHARHAAKAALKARRRIEAQHRRDEALQRAGFDAKIALSSGPAVVGNVGSEHRYNYTAIGETVNVCARIEGLSSDYNSPIIVSDDTVRQLGAGFLTHEIDLVRVKGKSDPIAIHAVLKRTIAANEGDRLSITLYADALARYRAGDFAAAAEIWARCVAAGGPAAAPARIMRARAEDFVRRPPELPWDGVWEKQGK